MTRTNRQTTENCGQPQFSHGMQVPPSWPTSVAAVLDRFEIWAVPGAREYSPSRRGGVAARQSEARSHLVSRRRGGAKREPDRAKPQSAKHEPDRAKPQSAKREPDRAKPQSKFGANAALRRSDHPVRSSTRRLRDILFLMSRPPLLAEEGN